MGLELVPFQPKGEVPEWRLIYDELVKLDVGDEITYERCARILGRSFGPHDNRGPLYRAEKELLVAEQRALEPVRGHGKRVVPAVEQRRLARNRQRFALRQVRRGRALVENVRVGDLTPTDARFFELHAMSLAGLEQLHRRQLRTETAVVAV
jgi:hypothetical protein